MTGFFVTNYEVVVIGSVGTFTVTLQTLTLTWIIFKYSARTAQ